MVSLIKKEKQMVIKSVDHCRPSDWSRQLAKFLRAKLLTHRGNGDCLLCLSFPLLCYWAFIFRPCGRAIQVTYQALVSALNNKNLLHMLLLSHEIREHGSILWDIVVLRKRYIKFPSCNKQHFIESDWHFSLC